MKIKSLAVMAFAFVTSVIAIAEASESDAIHACALLRTSYYSDSEKEDIQFYCNLPARTRNILPPIYWLKQSDYQKMFLLTQPTKPQAPRNLGDLDDVKVSRILNHPNVCQFFSVISPSVQYGRVKEGDRLLIPRDSEDLLEKCEALDRRIVSGEISKCSTIELAGHSTQSVGLDTIIGIDYASGEKQIIPARGLVSEIARCFKRILVPTGGIVSSTCGGEKAPSGQYHFWRKKSAAQQELSNLLGLPIISGIGPVSFASKYGHNGAEAVGGWTITYPRN